jgi:hypothetical protein
VSGPGAIPYVVGQWVRGERFYGRSALLGKLCSDARRLTWVAGTRRIGKTSLLKELERLTCGRGHPLVPLYWDLQGADTPDELSATFGDAVLDAGDTLSGLGLDPDRLATLDLFTAVERLCQTLTSQGRSLLLLGDEAEELVTLARSHREPLGRLAGLLERPGVTAVLVSSVRLSALAECGAEGASLLEAASPPLFLAPLGDAEATALVRQEQLPARLQPRLAGPLVEAICRHCGNHPFLLQLLAKRVLECGDLALAVEELHHDRVLAHLFAVDLGLLAPEERALLYALARGGEAGESGADRLLELGLVRRSAGGELEPGNDFLAAWLAASPDPHGKLT